MNFVLFQNFGRLYCDFTSLYLKYIFKQRMFENITTWKKLKDSTNEIYQIQGNTRYDYNLNDNEVSQTGQ